MILDDVLLDLGVSLDDIQKAKQYQVKFGGLLEKILVNMGGLSEDSLPIIYSKVLDLPLFDPNQYNDWDIKDQNMPASMNLKFLISHGWLPLVYDESKRTITYLTKQPISNAVSQFNSLNNFHYNVLIAHPSDFERFANIVDVEKTKIEDNINLSDIEEDRLRELASEAPTVNLLNSLISRALKQKASDMHVEPVNGIYRVRFRIDGVLTDIETIPKRLELAVVSRLKILSGMDIAEKRRPQDGKIETRVANIPLDIRVSILPLHDGESVVMRFLRKDSINYNFDAMGLSQDVEQCILQDLTKTSGVVLLTGPTGSGKTTTLYTFLNELNKNDVKIITLEDPVEYQLPGLNQVQVKPEIDFDFSAGLRSIVRQDPDIIMVGEIRDSETCRIAMQAALTGHLVFSTVHTNDAPSAFTRLLDLGVQEFLLNAGLVSIIAQRLSRKLCQNCAIPDPLEKECIDRYNLNDLVSRFAQTDIKLLKSVGCEHCNNTGYQGRFAVIEYLRCDEYIKSIPKDENFISKAKEYNMQMGFRTLLEDGLLKATRGQTSIEEVIRVCG